MPDAIVRLHSYDDIGSITTYRVAAALAVHGTTSYAGLPSEELLFTLIPGSRPIAVHVDGC